MLTIEEIQKVARLSKLELTGEELKKHQIELSGILDFFKKLSKVETENVDPLFQVNGLENVIRKDKVENFPAEKLLECSPREKSQHMISVPNVF